MLWELRAGAWRTFGLGVVEFTKTFRGYILRQWTRERKLVYYNGIYIGVIVGWTLKPVLVIAGGQKLGLWCSWAVLRVFFSQLVHLEPELFPAAHLPLDTT